MATIESLSALEILDSRGRPTIRAACRLSSGALGVADVPSGASTGTAEALELRDGDPGRYRGLGCRKAVGHVRGLLNHALAGREFDQASLDRAMIDLDGTPNKARVGANAILSVSLAFARACALERNIPLYACFAALAGRSAVTLPRPTINLFSGGKHAGGQVPIQDVLVVAMSAATMDEALAMTYAVYQSAADLIKRKYGMRALTADEGGLAPDFKSASQMLSDAVEAIEGAGYQPGREVAIAIDVASSHFYRDGRYHLSASMQLEASAMIDAVAGWVDQFPIVSVEDGLSEDDWEYWPLLRERIGGKALVLGDDLLCTNPTRIRRAVEANAADALLLKVNQIGSLTEALEAFTLARAANWAVTVSARSGETEDNWLADLAVGWGGDQIKIGSITQSERLAKYNRLLEIEATAAFPLAVWPG